MDIIDASYKEESLWRTHSDVMEWKPGCHYKQSLNVVVYDKLSVSEWSGLLINAHDEDQVRICLPANSAQARVEAELELEKRRQTNRSQTLL